MWFGFGFGLGTLVFGLETQRLKIKGRGAKDLRSGIENLRPKTKDLLSNV
jgi:hypothetical protein